MALPVPQTFPHEVDAFALRIRTEVAIPGAPPAPPGTAQPDLSVIFGKADPPPDAVSAATLRYSPGHLFLEVPGTARFLYRHLQNTLVVEPLPTSLATHVSALLIASALPAVLWMRGRIVLHAAAAVLPGATEAIAFAGPSGSGKSTLLRHLLAAGARVVADDTLSLDPATRHIAGLPGVILLRESAGKPPTEVPVPPAFQLASATLGALVLLTGAEHPTQRLQGLAAFEAILKNLHRPRMPRLLARMPVVLPQLAAMLPGLPVYSSNRLPWFTPGFPGLQQLTGELRGKP